MSTWTPPRPTYHLRIFAVSLVLVALALVVMLFGVELEAVVPATGTVTAATSTQLTVSNLSGLAIGPLTAIVTRDGVS